MNIEYMSNQVTFNLEGSTNFVACDLGTQDFYDSPTTLSIDYFHRKGNVLADLDIARKYFKNLKYVN